MYRTFTVNNVDSDYLPTLKMELTAGRNFSAEKPSDERRSILVNEAFVKSYGWTDPVGKRIHLGRRSSTSPWLTIVGIVGDVRHSEVTGPSRPEIYRLLAQYPQAMMMLAVRVSGDEHELTGHVRAAVAAVDPAQPVYHVKTLKRLVDEALLPSAATTLKSSGRRDLIAATCSGDMSMFTPRQPALCRSRVFEYMIG